MLSVRGGAELLRPGGLVSLRSWAARRAVPVGDAGDDAGLLSELALAGRRRFPEVEENRREVAAA
eukprot:15380491-Heterocapsa_arctica.AAC.1